MIFALTVDGPAQLARAFGGARAKFERAISREMKQLVLIVAGRAKFHIRGSRASNPPEQLGVVTGRLRQSITGRVEVRGIQVRGIIGPQRVAYAAIHELGGQAGRRSARVDIPARPYLAPALEESRDLIVERLGVAIDSAIKVT